MGHYINMITWLKPKKAYWPGVREAGQAHGAGLFREAQHKLIEAVHGDYQVPLGGNKSADKSAIGG